MPLHQYIQVQRKNLDSALRWQLFGAACPRMSRLYQLAISAVPNHKPPIFGQFLLICHKSFLAAATLIGQAQPEDTGPITRRAIEVVRLAAAMKDDPAVLEKWGAYEKREQRWKARNKGKIPKPLRINIPVTDPIVKQLVDSWGIISDTDVHFTPEYLISLSWQKQNGSMFLSYFAGEERTIESAILHLLGAHMMMLRVLNRCFDNVLSQGAEWQTLADEIFAVAKPYARKLEHAPALGEPDAQS